MKDYPNLYLKCYALLLAGMFEKNRNGSVKNYELCMSHYLSAPALSWYTMLNMAKVEYELVQMPSCICSLKKE